MTEEKLRELLQAAFPDATITTYDYTGGGDHWRVTIVAEAFTDKNLVERHQMVYKALGDKMKSEIHALSLETKAPSE